MKVVVDWRARGCRGEEEKIDRVGVALRSGRSVVERSEVLLKLGLPDSYSYKNLNPGEDTRAKRTQTTKQDHHEQA